MGFSKLNEVVQALEAGGLRAQRGFPVEVMPDLKGTVAAVQLESITPEQTKVAVYVLSPLGGRACEYGAQLAATALESNGAVYSVEACAFDKETGLFICRVIGTWNTSTDCVVRIENKNLEHLRSVSVKRSVSRELVLDWDTEEMVEECTDQGWNITMEELLPADSMPQADLQEEFTLYIFRTNGYERYNNCRWMQISLESVANGLLRTRVARTWEDRQVFE